jgi:hypothetical protein
VERRRKNCKGKSTNGQIHYIYCPHPPIPKALQHYQVRFAFIGVFPLALFLSSTPLSVHKTEDGTGMGRDKRHLRDVALDRYSSSGCRLKKRYKRDYCFKKWMERPHVNAHEIFTSCSRPHSSSSHRYHPVYFWSFSFHSPHTFSNFSPFIFVSLFFSFVICHVVFYMSLRVCLLFFLVLYICFPSAGLALSTEHWAMG